MRATLAIVLGLLLVASASVAVPMGHGAHGDRMHQAKANADASDQRFEGNAKASAGLDKAAQKGLFGRLTLTGSSVSGKWVSFNFTNVGNLTNFTYNQTILFSSVDIEGFVRNTSAAGTGAKVTGSLFRLVGTDALVRAHNNPTAHIRIVNGGPARDVVFTLGSGHTAAAPANNQTQVTWAGVGGSSHGHIVVHNGTIAVGGGKVTVNLSANGTVAFVVHPAGSNPAALHAVNTAMAKGKLGAQASLVDVDGVAVAQGDELEVGIGTGAVSAKRASLNFSAPSGVKDKVVVIHLPADAVSGITRANAQVRIGGQQATLAAPENVVNAAAGARSANVTFNPDGSITIIATIPSFSTQEVAIQSTDYGTGGNTGGDTNNPPAEQPKSGTPAPAALAALAVLGLAAFALRRRRA